MLWLNIETDIFIDIDLLLWTTLVTLGKKNMFVTILSLYDKN